jgi:uncharacterized protein (TIGR03435 family)
MRISRIAVLSFLVAALSSDVGTQSPPSSQAPTFDVVSVKPNTTGALGSAVNERPDGGLTMSNLPVSFLIGRAYAPAVPVDMVGLPGWAMSERYDVSATSTSPRATPEERTAMLRAMLADRFKLVVHFEKREQPVYDLVLARSDGRLGPGLQSGSNVDCAARAAAQRAANEAALAAGTPTPRPTPPDLSGPMLQCSFRIMGARMDGDVPMSTLAFMLRASASRPVVDKTGLTGTYRVTLEHDRMLGLRGPDVAPQTDGPPSVFTAVQEQLGLKLEPSTAERDTLVVDRLERPTEN